MLPLGAEIFFDKKNSFPQIAYVPWMIVQMHHHLLSVLTV